MLWSRCRTWTRGFCISRKSGRNTQWLRFAKRFALMEAVMTHTTVWRGCWGELGRKAEADKEFTVAQELHEKDRRAVAADPQWAAVAQDDMDEGISSGELNGEEFWNSVDRETNTMLAP